MSEPLAEYALEVVRKISRWRKAGYVGFMVVEDDPDFTEYLIHAALDMAFGKVYLVEPGRAGAGVPPPLLQVSRTSNDQLSYRLVPPVTNGIPSLLHVLEQQDGRAPDDPSLKDKPLNNIVIVANVTPHWINSNALILLSALRSAMALRNRNILIFVADDEVAHSIANNKQFQFSVRVVPRRRATMDDVLRILNSVKPVFVEKGIFDQEEDLTAYARALVNLPFSLVKKALMDSALTKKYEGVPVFQGLLQFKQKLFMRAEVEFLIPKYGFEAVGGYDYLKQLAERELITPLRRKELASKLNVELPKGILFYGPPGTGKSHFAKALAKEIGIPFIYLKLERAFSKWYGETAKTISSLTDILQSLKPAVVFIDEIEGFMVRRGQETHEETLRAMSVLLRFIQEAEDIVFIGATNKPEVIDEAFLRAGRFDILVPVLYPDEDARREIFRVHVEVMKPVPHQKLDYRELARMTPWFTGADIEAVVREAKRLLLLDAVGSKTPKLSMRHLREAIEDYDPQVEEKRRLLDQYYQLSQRFIRSKKIRKIIDDVYTKLTAEARTQHSLVEEI